MSLIRIVTDSTSDISKEAQQEYGIEVIPLKVHFGNDTYYDGIDIEPGDFYAKLAASEELPTTSQPSPVDFMELYRKLNGPDTEIISIHISSALSGTYQSAMLAKSLLEEQAEVHIIDSRSASCGHGELAIIAAREARAGKSAEEIIAKIEQVRASSRIYFLVDTLQYLYKGGRIGKASALFGSLLGIKPILTIDDSGEVAPVDKVRGHKKAVSRMIELLAEDFADKPIHLVIAHSEAKESAEGLMQMVKARLNVTTESYTKLGPVIGAHTGPGTLAVFAYPV